MADARRIGRARAAIARLAAGLTARAAAAALALALGVAAPARAVEAGDSAPDVALPGSSVGARLSELRGRWVYLDFWASWCAPCLQSFPWMAQLQQKYAAAGLLVLAVNVDAQRADADAFLARHPAGFALAFDAQGDAARRFAIRGMPSSVLIDPLGRVRWVHRGFRADDAALLDARIAQALAEPR